MKAKYTLTIKNISADYDENLEIGESLEYVGSLNSIQNFLPENDEINDYEYDIIDNETGEIIESNCCKWLN